MMLITELITRLEKLKAEHGDGPVYASCHKNNMFYEPIPQWRSLEYFSGGETKGVILCSPIEMYGCVTGRF